MPYSIGILTVSDRAHAKVYADASGERIKTLLSASNMNASAYEIVPDDMSAICAMLERFSDALKLDVVLTTGGTGLGPRDVTPEATNAVCKKMVPGLGEWLRMESVKHTPKAVLSRGVAGLRGRTLIINLPGSPKAVEEYMALLMPLLPHALAMIDGAGHA